MLRVCVASAIPNPVLTGGKEKKNKKEGEEEEKKPQTAPNCSTCSWKQDVAHMRLSQGESLLKITYADYVHKMS